MVNDEKKAENKAVPIELYNFFIDIDFIEDGILTLKAKEYYELRFVLDQIEETDLIIQENLINNSIVNLIVQVFYGRGNIKKSQICNLLNLHHVSKELITEGSISSLVVLLNKYSILTYDKKKSIVYVNEKLPRKDLDIKEYFVEPSTPFSNIYNLRKALRTCKGDIYWLDKHFRKEGLEMILDGLSSTEVKTVTIISGTDNLTQSAKSDFVRLRDELKYRNIIVDWRIIDAGDFKWHDRWLISDTNCFNIPPVLALIRGQRSEIIKTESNINIAGFVNESYSISV
ncbi:hypothetical protein [Sedimentibacter sp.]|uniref:hypothetical protein n=1 Tax=Sedimentibacter sp. TaxID=1960295 RepID=UPI00289FDAAA|nr:hypothetical protein [Sedimentibacter sp.]